MKRSSLGLRRALLALALPVGALLAASCQSIAGIDEYKLGPCGDFCDTVMANCTGVNLVYASRDNCMGVCEVLPPGDPDEPDGNTVACRYLAALDAATAEADISCQRAGPGGSYENDEAPCGESACANYCYLYDEMCSQAQTPLQKSCLQNCLGLRDEGVLHASNDHEGDTLQCRLVHLSAAKSDPKYHCGHAQLANPTDWCNNDDLKPTRLPDCGDFCKLVTHVCADTFSVYESEDQCKALCQHLEVGDNADNKGQNTRGCRKYHTYNAMNDAVTHCPHVGPGGAGVCGDSMTGNCDSYCRISSLACPSEFNQHFTDADDCLAQCAEVDPGGKYSIAQAESESSTLGCRFLALSRASEAGLDSAPCGDAFGDPGTACE